MKKLYLFFGVIMMVAIAVRMYGLWNLPLFGDELGVLIRTTGVGLRELISWRIMEQDVHPLGLQVLYFTLYQGLGLDLPWLKLLSVLASLGSMWLVFSIARMRSIQPWIALSCMAVLQIFVFYSTLIRPYAFAQCALLAYVYVYLRSVKKGYLTWRNVGLLSVLLVVTATIHYMAVLSGVVYYLFSFPLRKKSAFLWRYLSIGGCALLLYIPQFPVFFYHLGKGDPGQWLSAPDVTFLWNFVRYVFHYSEVLLLGVMLLLIAGLGFRVKESHSQQVYWNGLFVFVGVLAIVWGYSILIAPMLQFSTLFIALPLLLLFLSSLVPFHREKVHLLGAAFVLVVGFVSLVYQRQHHTRIALSDTETLNVLAGTFAQEGGAAFVLQPAAHHQFFSSYSRVPKSTIHSLDTQRFEVISETILSDTLQHIGYGWNKYQHFERIPWLYDHFGAPTHKVDLYNAQWLEFDRAAPQDPKHVLVKPIMPILRGKGWKGSDVYSPVHRIPLSELTSSAYQYISLRAKVEAVDAEQPYFLVLKLVRNGASVHDVIQPVNRFVSSERSGYAYATVLPFAITADTQDLQVEFFIWNPAGEEVQVSELDVVVTPGNEAALGIIREN